MFKCKECGLEYNIKPDYCDCGNDVFEEVNGSAVSNNNVYHEQQMQSKRINPSPKSFDEQYPELVRFKQAFDPISTVIFGICFILAFVILFFIGNPEEKSAEQVAKEQKPEAKVVQNIPSIDSLWNSSTVGIINNEKSLAAKYAGKTTSSQTQQQVSQPLQPQQVPQTLIPVSQPQPKTQPTPKTQPQPKTQQTAAQSQQQPKQGNIISNLFNKNTNTSSQAKQTTKTTTTTTTQQSKPNIPKTTQSIASGTSGSGKVSNGAVNASNSFNNKTQSATTTPKQQTKSAQSSVNTAAASAAAKTSAQNSTLRPKAVIDTQALQKELASYKVGLQNTLGRKIDFANVIGDGDCVVSFKISSAGQLTNRSFTKQSSNVTLNDAVYSAIMSTPKYNAPPSGYKGETMSFSVRFYNGNIGVSLK